MGISNGIYDQHDFVNMSWGCNLNSVVGILLISTEIEKCWYGQYDPPPHEQVHVVEVQEPLFNVIYFLFY